MYDFFEPTTLNIFTDASTISAMQGQTNVTSAGAIAIAGKNVSNILLEDYQVLAETNNFGELYAITLGIQLAIRLRNVMPIITINIFSDSAWALFGMRDWSERWLLKSEKNNNIFKNLGGSTVAHQELFKYNMSLIVSYGIKINFYHVRGHVANTKKCIASAARSFVNNNKYPNPSTEFMKIITHMNNVVDRKSREFLNYSLTNSFNKFSMLYRREFPINKEQANQYLSLKNNTASNRRRIKHHGK